MHDSSDASNNPTRSRTARLAPGLVALLLMVGSQPLQLPAAQANGTVARRTPPGSIELGRIAAAVAELQACPHWNDVGPHPARRRLLLRSLTRLGGYDLGTLQVVFALAGHKILSTGGLNNMRLRQRLNDKALMLSRFLFRIPPVLPDRVGDTGGASIGSSEVTIRDLGTGVSKALGGPQNNLFPFVCEKGSLTIPLAPHELIPGWAQDYPALSDVLKVFRYFAEHYGPRSKPGRCDLATDGIGGPLPAAFRLPELPTLQPFEGVNNPFYPGWFGLHLDQAGTTLLMTSASRWIPCLVWDYPEWKVSNPIQAGGVGTLSRNGIVVVNQGYNSTGVYSRSGEETARLGSTDDDLASVSPNGRWVVTADRLRGTFRLWDGTRQFAKIRQVITGAERLGRVCFTPDSVRIAVSTYRVSDVRPMNGRISILDAATGKLVRSIPADVAPVYSDLEFSSDGSAIMANGRRDIGVWDVATGKVVCRICRPETVSVARLSPCGRTLATAEVSGMVSAFSLSGKLLATTRAARGRSRIRLSFSRDGERLAVAMGRTTQVRELPTLRVIRTIMEQGRVGDVIFSPDGKSLLISTTGYIVHVVDVGTGAKVRDYTPGEYE